MAPFTVEELAIPASVTGVDAADFVATVGVRNAVEALGYGSDELSLTPAEVLQGWLDPEHSPRRLFGVRVDGALVSRAIYEWSVATDDRVAWTAVEVLPEFRDRGIGTALADHVEAIAVADARARLLVYVVSPDAPGERLVPPTRAGSVPLSGTEVRFLQGRGFTLEQVVRASRLELPVEAHRLRELVSASSARSGPAYAVHTWTGATPARWVADMAALFTRMSTDAPSAGLEEPEDPWTPTRVAEEDARLARSPRAQLCAAVEHVPTGRLVGYSILAAPAERSRAVSQEDTLVLREHRGHALGMLLKVANLEHLARRRPGHPSIVTFNAEENRHMLRVNEALGFRPIGYEGAWRKVLGAEAG